MSLTFAATLQGKDMGGFTAAIFDNEDDTAVKPTAVQRAFTGENSGTFPAGIVFHSVSAPFTYTVERPAQFKTLGPVNPVTGKLGNIPRNVFVLRTRKGVIPLAGQASSTMVIETKISVPAGADVADLDNIHAGLSVHFGEASSLSSQLGDLMGDGIL